jgi:hypothetical protein
MLAKSAAFASFAPSRCNVPFFSQRSFLRHKAARKRVPRTHVQSFTTHDDNPPSPPAHLSEVEGINVPAPNAPLAEVEGYNLSCPSREGRGEQSALARHSDARHATAPW